ncbi:MAG: KH domain-containing protein [bacterium JZ-2024 1]
MKGPGGSFRVVEAVGRTESEATHRALRELKALPEEVELVVKKRPDGTYYARAEIKERKESLALVESFLETVVQSFLPESDAWFVLTDVTERLVRYNIMADKAEKLGALIGKRGTTLLAVQTIARELFARKQDRRRLIIDAGNYLRKREQALRELFQKSVAKVLQEKKELDLGALPREDREMIYEWARATPEVALRTVGPAEERHIVLIPMVKG